MNSRLWSLSGTIFLAFALLSLPSRGDDAPTSPAAAESKQDTNSSSDAKDATTAQGLCVRECTRSNARCSAQVRHARSECSRSAALNGEEPMGSNRDVEAFCGYFRNPSTCNSKNADKRCTERFREHYTMCLAAVRPNVMSSRYDCFQEERQAENMCRSELNDCKAACYQ